MAALLRRSVALEPRDTRIFLPIDQRRRARQQGSNYEIRVILGRYLLRFVTNHLQRACGTDPRFSSEAKTNPLCGTAGFHQKAWMKSNHNLWKSTIIAMRNRALTELPIDGSHAKPYIDRETLCSCRNISPRTGGLVPNLAECAPHRLQAR